MSANISAGALNVAMNVIIDAGKYVNQHISKLDRIEVRERQDSHHRRSWVSSVNIEAEQLLIEGLRQTYPDFSINARESGEENKESEYSWLINPLSGTLNFLHGHPQCAIGVALLHESTTVAATIYDPFRNELFSARKGGGAQLDGRRIRVSQTSRLSDSLLCTAPPGDKDSTKLWLKSYAQLLPRAQAIHHSNACLLDLAFVSAGRYDAFWHMHTNSWDATIGGLIVQEAGGLLSHSKNILIAGTPKVHEKLHFMTTGT